MSAVSRYAKLAEDIRARLAAIKENGEYQLGEKARLTRELADIDAYIRMSVERTNHS
jgi:hypothetical protein